MDAIAELSRLREAYPKVVIQGRKKAIEGEIVAQYWMKTESNIKCRLVRPKRTKYISVFEFEKVLAEAMRLQKLPKVVSGPKDLSPMKYGKGLIAMLGGAARWCGSKYLAVSLPEQGEFLLPSWRGWLRFMEWTGQNPHQRRWSDEQKLLLVASGQYAWIVVMDRGVNQAKVLYSGGVKINFESAWFPLSKPEEMQRILVQVTEHADQHKWRDAEIMCQTEPVLKRQRKVRVEITRVPDEDVHLSDDFSDPLTPDGYSGDLGERYQDE